MHHHRTALWRSLTDHRHELLLATALSATTVALAVVGPLLLLVAAVEGMSSKRKREPVGLTLTVALARAVAWLWRELHEQPHGRWHPCSQCGKPIEEPSRAAFCSHACRSYARLERDAQANDPRIADRAERRLRTIRLQKQAAETPAWDEVPF
jgi:hypothetical protein